MRESLRPIADICLRQKGRRRRVQTGGQTISGCCRSGETFHAHSHLRALGAVKSTKENIQEAIVGETHEFKKMYPEMLTKAKAEGIKPAEMSFDYANQVEKIHAALYEKAMAELGKNKAADYYVCPVCGNTVEENAQSECPICGTAGSKFIKVS